MKTKNTLISGIIAATQSNRMRSSLLTLAIFATFLVATGCKPHH